MLSEQVDLLWRYLDIPGTFLFIHVVLGVGLLGSIIALKRIICLFKQLVNKHLVHFVLYEVLDCFVEVNAFLCSQEEVLQEII